MALRLRRGRPSRVRLATGQYASCHRVVLRRRATAASSRVESTRAPCAMIPTPPLNGAGSGDRVVGASTAGLALGPGTGWAVPPGAVPAAVGGRRGRRLKNLDLLCGVSGLLECQHRGLMDLGQVLEHGDVCVEARAVKTDELNGARPVPVRGARVLAQCSPFAPWATCGWSQHGHRVADVTGVLAPAASRSLPLVERDSLAVVRARPEGVAVRLSGARGYFLSAVVVPVGGAWVR